MKLSTNTTRRQALGALGRAAAGLAALFAAKRVKAATQSVVSAPAPKGYDPMAHSWQYAIDVEKCIGCGLCAEACKKENHVSTEPGCFRTWVERYIIRKPKTGDVAARGETEVDSPNAGIGGFPPSPVPKQEILKSFFVPKLCNHCVSSPCVQSCPVGATFDTPDGVVLVDPQYCIGCGFCIQSCPYGCRFLSPKTHTAEKCTFCYHRITHGLKPACVEVCPTGARMFGDMKNPASAVTIQTFVAKNKVHVLKPHLGARPKLLYAGLDTEVR